MPTLSRSEKNLVILIAFAVGVLAANIYYSQPILQLIAQSLDIRPDAAGLVMTATQVGYGLGVLFLVPLGDLVENKRLILSLMGVCIVGELGLAFFQSLAPYFVVSVLAGIGAAAVQVLVPYTTHLFDSRLRGVIIGTLMSGLMFGIMLSRPLASLVADSFGYHPVFLISAVLMLGLLLVLNHRLPQRRPAPTQAGYPQLLLSMLKLLRDTTTLQRRAFYQACLFGSFCLYWTIVPLMLTQSEFHFSQKQVALFALVGVAGAAVAPFAGRLADRGLGRRASQAALMAATLAFALNFFISPGSWLSLGLLLLTANLLDAGVSAHLVLGQRAVFMIDPRNQSRLNGLYLALIYVGGAVGSALGAWAWTHGGWTLANIAGGVLPLTALVVWSTEKFFAYSEAH